MIPPHGNTARFPARFGHDPRASAAGLRRAGGAVPPEVFAAALAARLATRAGDGPFAPGVLRRGPAPLLRTLVHAPLHLVHLTASVNVQFAAPAGRDAAVPRPATFELPRATAAPPRHLRRITAEMVERLERRSRRVERLPVESVSPPELVSERRLHARGAAPDAPAAAVDATTSAPRVFRRSAPRPSLVDTAAPSAGISAAPPRPATHAHTLPPWPRVSPPAPAAGLPPAELRRVTDHVVAAIDRRLTALRERRGGR